MPQFDWVEELTARLEHTFNLKTDDNILSFEENPFLTGREYIGNIYNAIVSKKVLLITYKPFKTDRELLFEIHPYHLKQYNNRWFLFGLNNEYGSITNLALDRIQKINESKTKYITNTKIDFSDYFDDVIGVSVDEAQEPQKVVLKADDDLLPYITSKPMHGSQKIKKDEEGTRIELKLQLNYELESTILSFGEKIEVAEPEALRAAITNRIKVLNLKYTTCV
nr:WYL domain-containing protein [Maribellus sp. YY47]